jgi:hypothetical protein
MALVALGLATSCSDTPSSGNPARPAVSGAADLPAPQYPNRMLPQPSVPPSNFAEGQPFDWENPAAQAPPDGRLTTAFSSTRSFEETSRWIQSTLGRYLESRAQPWLTTVSHVQFRGCVMEWDQQILYKDYNPPQVNETIFSINLGDLDISKISRYGVSSRGDELRIDWQEGDNPITGRSWVLVNGSWRPKGPGSTAFHSSFSFPVANRDNAAVRLAYAMIHAGRLCGATARY